MSKLRTFIIEDDLIHASNLEMLLDQLGYLVVGSTGNSDDATSMISAIKPDLLFVDIMLNGQLDGIELVERIQGRLNIPVIFITSLRTEDTIARAMKVKPHAYILKPFEKATLQTAIELAVARFVDPEEQTNNRHSWENDRLNSSHFFIKSAGTLDKIELGDIHYIEVKDKLCIMAMANEEREVRMPLSTLEQRLGSQFLRVHRSFLVNLHVVSRVDWVQSMIFVGQYEVPIGRSYRETIKSKLDSQYL